MQLRYLMPLPSQSSTPHDCPPELVLDMPDWVGTVSSTRARTTDPTLMAPAAASFDAHTGAWTDPVRYEAWLSG